MSHREHCPTSARVVRLTGYLMAPCLLLGAQPAPAEILGAGGVTFEGGLTATAQYVDDSAIDSEALMSVDLVATVAQGRGTWTAYVEGNLTPSGTPAVPGELNADSGSALNSNDRGRVQISELHYSYPFGGRAVVAGLVDATAFLDTSEVANDETSQFLGGSFVNNPTVEFPDYAPGGAFQSEPSGTLPGYLVVVTSSHGLADNPKRSYSQLSEVSAQGKGVFVAAELFQSIAATVLRVGGWSHTADHARLDGAVGMEPSFGLYALADGRFGAGQWSMRLGWANEQTSEAANFIATSAAYPVHPKASVGVAVARTGASRHLAGAADMYHAEAYARIDVFDNLQVTPSVQVVRNAAFGLDGGFDGDALAAGARVSYAF